MRTSAVTTNTDEIIRPCMSTSGNHSFAKYKSIKIPEVPTVLTWKSWQTITEGGLWSKLSCRWLWLTFKLTAKHRWARQHTFSVLPHQTPRTYWRFQVPQLANSFINLQLVLLITWLVKSKPTGAHSLLHTCRPSLHVHAFRLSLQLGAMSWFHAYWMSQQTSRYVICLLRR